MNYYELGLQKSAQIKYPRFAWNLGKGLIRGGWRGANWLGKKWREGGEMWRGGHEIATRTPQLLSKAEQSLAAAEQKYERLADQTQKLLSTWQTRMQELAPGTQAAGQLGKDVKAMRARGADWLNRFLGHFKTPEGGWDWGRAAMYSGGGIGILLLLRWLLSRGGGHGRGYGGYYGQQRGYF